MVTLYSTPLSSSGRKVLVATQHLGLPIEVKLVNIYKGEGRTPEYLSINPSGKIPALVDGDLKLWESNAILQYLSEGLGDFRLSSRDPKRRADITRWLFWEASAWHAAFYPLLADFVFQRIMPQASSLAPIKVNWQEARVRAVLEFLDGHLRGREFIVGDELSLADIALGTMMMYARPALFPFEDFPRITAWSERLESLEAWKATSVAPWK